MDSRYWLVFREAYKHGDVTPDNRDAIYRFYQSEGRDRIVEAVKKKKLMAAVAKLFSDLDIDKDYWQPQVQFYRNRNIDVVSSMDEMYKTFEKNGISHIAVVENFGALLSSSQDICMFNSGDADQYGDIAFKDDVYGVLKDAGYELGEVFAGNILISSSIRHKTRIPEGFYFGINWDVTTRVNLPCISSCGPIIEWNKCYRYKDTCILLPSAETLMYICMMHVAVHGFCKAPDIRLYFDVANVADNEIDWSILIGWAKRDHNEVKLATAATLSKKLLDVEIPDEVMSLGNRKQVDKLISVVYNEKENRLSDFPNAKQRVLIDIYSNDYGVVQGVNSILFPEKDWIKGKYGSVAVGRIKHLKSLVRP